MLRPPVACYVDVLLSPLVISKYEMEDEDYDIVCQDDEDIYEDLCSTKRKSTRSSSAASHSHTVRTG